MFLGCMVHYRRLYRLKYLPLPTNIIKKLAYIQLLVILNSIIQMNVIHGLFDLLQLQIIFKVLVNLPHTLDVKLITFRVYKGAILFLKNG